MGKFEITTPDGKKFEIEAADAQAANATLEEFMAQGKGAQPEGGTVPAPPAGAKPGSHEYAAWAAQQARAGNGRNLPQVSDPQYTQTQSSALDPFVQGTTFGWGDEMRGAVQGGLAALQGGDYGSTYAQSVDQSRNALEHERSVNPVGSIASELGGGIATSIAAAPALGPLAGLGVAGKVLPMWQQILRGGMLAIPGGAVYGAGSAGDGLQERATGAVKGLATAAVGGAAAPVILRGAGAAIKTIGNRFAANSAAKAAGVSPEAARFAAETLHADDTLGSGAQRMAQAGDERMIADAGQSATNLLDFAIQKSGKAGRVATDAIDGRVSRDAQAITKALDDALGVPKGVETTRAQIRSDSAAARHAAYDGPGGAYDTPIDYASAKGVQLQNILKRVSQADINAANELMRAEGFQSKQILAKVAPDGSITYQRLPDVRQIDYITRALNDRSQANNGLGALGGQTNAGRVYQNLSGDVRDATRDAVPEYGVALDTAADPIQRSKAVQFGADLLSSGVTREQVGNAVVRMSAPEREAVAQGIRSKFDDMLANVARTVQDGDVPAREAIHALKQMSTRANREKITMAIGRQKADTLFEEVDRATKSFDLRANVATNTKTFQRQEMERRVQQTTAPDGPIASIMRGEPLNAGKRATQMLTGQTSETALRQQDQIMTEIVQMLTAKGYAADDVLQILKGLGGRLGGGQALADNFRIAGERLALPAGIATEQTRQFSGR